MVKIDPMLLLPTYAGLSYRNIPLKRLHLPILRNLSSYNDKFYIGYTICHLSIFQVLCRISGHYPNLVDQSRQKMAHTLNHYQYKSKMYLSFISINYLSPLTITSKNLPKRFLFKIDK